MIAVDFRGPGIRVGSDGDRRAEVDGRVRNRLSDNSGGLAVKRRQAEAPLRGCIFFSRRGRSNPVQNASGEPQATVSVSPR